MLFHMLLRLLQKRGGYHSMAENKSQLSYNVARMKEMGSRYSTIGDDTELARDVDTLYDKYMPLRKKIAGMLSGRLNRQVDKDDLISFVNEHFVRLVKEYDPTSNVDFPGYISIMLPLRARASFMGSLDRVYSRENTTDGDEDVLSFLDNSSNRENLESIKGLLEYITSSVDLNETEYVILEGMLEGKRITKLEDDAIISSGISRSDAKALISEVKQAIRSIVETYINE